MTEHTALPWIAQEYDTAENGIGIIGLCSSDGIPYESPTNGLVAWVMLSPLEMECGDTSRAKENATFIVKAVNNYGAILKALQDILSANDDFRSNLPDGWEGDPLQDACDRAKAIMGEAK